MPDERPPPKRRPASESVGVNSVAVKNKTIITANTFATLISKIIR